MSTAFEQWDASQNRPYSRRPKQNRAMRIEAWNAALEHAAGMLIEETKPMTPSVDSPFYMLQVLATEIRAEKAGAK